MNESGKQAIMLTKFVQIEPVKVKFTQSMSKAGHNHGIVVQKCMYFLSISRLCRILISFTGIAFREGVKELLG